MTPQHLEALRLANEVKRAQEAVLCELRHLSKREASERAAAHLRNPSEPVGRLSLDRFLRSLPRYGSFRVGRLLAEVGMPPGRLSRRVRELSERERGVLAGALEGER